MRGFAIVLSCVLVAGCATEKEYDTKVVKRQAEEYRQCAMSKAMELDNTSNSAADIAKEAIGLCFDQLDAINSLLREVNKDHPYYGLYANNYTDGLRDQVTTEVASEVLKRRAK